MTLEECIQQAYLLFGKYKAKAPLDLCTYCCATEEEGKTLVQKRARELSFELLCAYTDSAKNGIASNDEILHFLPRYFEFIANFQYPSNIATEITLQFMADLNWKKCSTQEQTTILEFGQFFFEKYLSFHSGQNLIDPVDDILIMLDIGGHFDIDRMLAFWTEQNDVASHQHLRDLYYHGFHTRNDKLQDSFASQKLSRQIYDWSHSQDFANKKKHQLEALFNSTQADSWEDGLFEELWEFYEYLGIVFSKQ